MAEKSWQDEVRESAHRIWLAGLGALSLAEQEGSKLFGELVQRGEKYEAEGKERMREAMSGAKSATAEAAAQAKDAAAQAKEQARRIAEAAREMWGKTSDNLDQSMAKALEKVGVPSRDEIQALSRRVAELTLAVERLRGGNAGAAPEPGAPEASGPAGEPAPAPTILTEDDVTTTTQDVTTRP